MNKNIKPARLVLNKETVRALDNSKLSLVGGGAIYRYPNQDPTYADACTWGNGSLCDVTTGYVC